MRKLYLLRHGEPDFPGGKKMCLGLTDLPLSRLGAMQSALCGAAVGDVEAVFCSFLARSRESGARMGAPVRVLPGLEELSPGEWDGLTFEEIRARWGELYRLRGEDPSVQPPGAEAPENGLARFSAALETALAATRGDIAVVSHATVLQLWLCRVQGMSLRAARSILLPYGSVTHFTVTDGEYRLASAPGELPHPALDEAVCRALLQAADTPEIVTDHCAAVAREAMRIVGALAAHGVSLDEADIFAAAYLHDVARGEDDHAARGAALADALGYGGMADMIAQHHDLRCGSALDGAAVVYLADKLVRGTQRVSLAVRFGASGAKCVTPEAVVAHKKRYADALALAERINSLCNRDIIPLTDD